MTSPKASASSMVPLEALGPASATRPASASGWRELNRTAWPACAHNLPITPPILPDPTIPIFMFALLRITASRRSCLPPDCSLCEPQEVGAVQAESLPSHPNLAVARFRQRD